MKAQRLLQILLFHRTLHVAVATTRHTNSAIRETNVRRRIAKRIELVANPLKTGQGKQCQGDCDSNSDCVGDLVCYHREKGERKIVPGCVGGEEDGSRTDYCINPADLDDNIFNHEDEGVTEEKETHEASIIDDQNFEALEYVANPLTNGKKCEGDCDTDEDCEGNLICFHRDKHEYKDVPGCSGGSRDGSRTDYCIAPEDAENFVAYDVVTANDEEESSTNGNEMGGGNGDGKDTSGEEDEGITVSSVTTDSSSAKQDQAPRYFLLQMILMAASTAIL